MPIRRIASALLASTALLLSGCLLDEPAASPPVTKAAPAPLPSAAQLLAEGDKRASGGDLYGAVDAYAAARRTEPDNVDAVARLGLALGEQGRFAEALEPLQAAQAARPDDPALLRGLANALLALERPAAAAAVAEAGLAHHPDDPRLWNAAGIAADMQGDRHAAEEAYRRGLAIAPENSALRVNQALSRFAAGDRAGAEAAAVGTGLGPDDIAARARRLVAYRDRAQDRAQGMAPAAIGKLPEAPPMAALALPPVRVQELPAAPTAVAEARPAAVQEPAAQPPAPAEHVQNDGAHGAQAHVPAQQADATPPEKRVAPEAVSAGAQDGARPTAGADEAAPVAPAPQLAAAPSTASQPAGAAASPAAWASSGTQAQVQIGAYGRASLAETQWRKFKTEQAALFEGLEPDIQRADLGPEKGVVFRLRIALPDRARAAAFCEQAKMAGIDCLLVPGA